MEETGNRKAMRKIWKSNAKKVLRSHYLLLVLLCLISVFYGTEFGIVKSNAEGLISLITGEPVTEHELKLDAQKARDKVLMDLAEDNAAAGNAKAAEQLEAYRKEGVTDSVLGRSSGIFASIANMFSSGRLYMMLFGGLHSIFHSTRFASALLVLIVMLGSAAFWIFVKNFYTAILRRIFLEARTYEIVPVAHVLHFRLVRRWIRGALTLLLQTVYETLWYLTIIGGIIKRYSYYLVPFIVAENPDIRPTEAIRLSRRIMNGHKWECFIMELSFFWWYLLGYISFGISDALWTAPYKTAAFAEFYAARRNEAKQNGIPGADQLNDEYLYEKADEMFLRKTYSDVEEQKHFIDENRVTLQGARAFFAKNFGLWVGRLEEKRQYDEVDNRRQQIVEDRAVIKGKIYPQRLNPLWDSKNNLVVRNVRSIRTYTIWSIILTFFVFAFVGWLWEVSIHIVGDGVFVNRGVLHGPWLPIYGGGVTMILLLLARWRRRPAAEAGLIVVLCGCVEYFTSYILEVTKGMRWWDYTGYFLNLNGRICGEGLLIFALGGMAAVYFLVPILDSLLSKVRPAILKTVSIVLLVVFVADFAYSMAVPNVGDGITDYSAYEEVSENAGL